MIDFHRFILGPLKCLLTVRRGGSNGYFIENQDII